MLDNLMIGKLFAIAFAFFFVSIQLKQLILVIHSLLFSKPLGLKCDSVSLFGLLLTRQNDKWVYTKGKPTLLCNANIKIDLDRELTEKQIERNDKIFTFSYRVILIIISVLLVFLFRGSMVKGLTLKGTISEVFAAYFAFGMCFHTVASIIIFIYTYEIAMKRLGGYYQTQITKIRSGVRFADLDLKPIDQLGYNNPSKAERGLYNTLYATYLTATDRIEELAAVAHDLTAQFHDSEYILQETPAYYFLIFYYSRYELNPNLAKHFLDKCISTISSDKDTNAKRVLAYYAFGIEQDFPKARKYLTEAFETYVNFSTGDERELERKLLWTLDRFLKDKKY